MRAGGELLGQIFHAEGTATEVHDLFAVVQLDAIFLRDAVEPFSAGFAAPNQACVSENCEVLGNVVGGDLEARRDGVYVLLVRQEESENSQAILFSERL